MSVLWEESSDEIFRTSLKEAWFFSSSKLLPLLGSSIERVEGVVFWLSSPFNFWVQDFSIFPSLES